MALHLLKTQLGRPAMALLARLIYESQLEDPLTPILVIVPSNLSGLTIRRLISSGVFADVAAAGGVDVGAADAGGVDVGAAAAGGGGLKRFSGFANVHFDTPFEIAERLGGRSLVDHPSVSRPAIESAIRVALDNTPGSFVNVKNSHKTQSALARAVQSLDSLDPETLENVARCNGVDGFENELVQLYHQTRAILKNYCLEADILEAIEHRPDLCEVLKKYGKVIWYLPELVSPKQLSMVGSVIRNAPDAAVIYSHTGNRAVDDLTRTVLNRAGIAIDDLANRDSVDSSETQDTDRNDSEPLASHIISACDAEEEVAAAIRELVTLISSGVKADRIGLFYTNSAPYARLVKQHLDSSGLAHNGAPTTTLAQSVTGRFLLGVLKLHSEQRSVAAVMGLVATAPVRLDKRRVLDSNWERIVRYARITGDRPNWHERLRSHIKYLKTSEAAGERVRGVTWPVDDVEQLDRFVTQLFNYVEHIAAAETWSAKCDVVNDMLTTMLGSVSQRATWPESEQDSYEGIEKALAQLSELDNLNLVDPKSANGNSSTVASPADLNFAVFHNAVKSSLDRDVSDDKRFGYGVHHSSLARASGSDFDAVFILGCSEGEAPKSAVLDPLLSEKAKVASNGLLPDRQTLRDLQHFFFLQALCSAPADRRWLLMSKTDARSGRLNQPSRWILPTASALSEKNIRPKDFDGVTPAGVTDVKSQIETFNTADHFTSLVERDLAALWHAQQNNRSIDTHELGDLIGDALKLIRARNSSEFSEYDGNLAGVETPDLTETVLSPTQLERWVQCGFSYLFEQILRVNPLEDPDDSNHFSHSDRGNVIHEILEKLGQVAIDTGLEPDQSWAVLDKEFDEICETVFAEVEQRSRTGREVLWHLNKGNVIAMIRAFLAIDDENRRVMKRHIGAVEHSFGSDSPVEIDIGRSAPLKFRGIIDRVDKVENESKNIVLIDYKSSKPDEYKKIDEHNPCDGGLRLQLGIYAEAIYQYFQADIVDTHFAMLADATEPIGYRAGGYQRKYLRDVLAGIVDAIEAGVFYGKHPTDSRYSSKDYKLCRYCKYKELHPADIGAYQRLKGDAPELTLRTRIAEIEVGESDNIEGMLNYD